MQDKMPNRFPRSPEARRRASRTRLGRHAKLVLEGTQMHPDVDDRRCVEARFPDAGALARCAVAVTVGLAMMGANMLAHAQPAPDSTSAPVAAPPRPAAAAPT